MSIRFEPFVGDQQGDGFRFTTVAASIDRDQTNLKHIAATKFCWRLLSAVTAHQIPRILGIELAAGLIHRHLVFFDRAAVQAVFVDYSVQRHVVLDTAH